MTDKKVVEVIAEFMGFYLIQPPEEDGTCGFSLRGLDNIFYPWRDTREEAWGDGPSFLESLDAIRPVLAKLSDEQREKLDARLRDLWIGSQKGISPSVATTAHRSVRWFFLTLPPRDLALAVAEVLEESNPNEQTCNWLQDGEGGL